jgi:hypothetical protein
MSQNVSHTESMQGQGGVPLPDGSWFMESFGSNGVRSDGSNSAVFCVRIAG